MTYFKNNQTLCRLILGLLFLLNGSSSMVLCAGTAGKSGADFLKMGVGAAAAGLAGTQAALTDDVYSLFWNPAGLAFARGPEISFAHNKAWADTQLQSALTALPLKNTGTLALGLTRLVTEEFPGFDAQGVPTGSLKSGAESAAVGWGMKILPGSSSGNGLSSGLTMKFFRENNGNVWGNGAAVDWGLLLRPWFGPESAASWLSHMSAGVSVKNLGRGPSFDRETVPLPSDFTAGVGYERFIAGDSLRWGADWHTPQGEKSYLTTGGEYWHRHFIALRGGILTSALHGTTVRCGAGLRVRRLQLDYAWAGWSADLGVSHHLGVTWSFGTVTPAGCSTVKEDDLFRFYVDEGRQRLGREEYENAVIDFHEALKIRPNDKEIMKLLLECGDKMRKTP